MTREELLSRKDYAESKIEELCDFINGTPPNEKGYEDLIQAYLKWTDIYDDILDQISNLDKADAKEAEAKKEKRIDLIFRSLDLACKIAVPILCISASIGVAKLSYAQDSQMQLCNGRVMGSAKDLMNLAKMKV